MKATCYLQVEPWFRRAWRNGEYSDVVNRISVQRVTQRRPESPIPGCVVVKLELDIADAAFEPLRPEVAVVIPVEHTQAVRVETEPLEVPT